MDGSCIESSTTSTVSITTPPSATKLPPESGTSAVSDPENGVEAESSKKLPSSKYKGVVPQPNGRWGAQIYEKHQRVWLGTFNTEQEAAIAYDTAVQRFRGPHAVTNLKFLEKDEIQTNFLNSHSKAEIVDMLRKHTYNDELEQCRRNCAGNNVTNKQNDNTRRFSDREHLFEKTVTPSDVGKLNRLVIPKQHAEKHFPLHTSKGILVNFEDMEGKVWRFRYSYWNSSQSYVLTKGWSRFVKEKNLRAGDVVSFQRSDDQLYIDWKSVHVVRLFGVNICQVPSQGGKRIMRQLELECKKKQRVMIDALTVT